MKRTNYFILFILAFVLLSNTIYAECSTDEYNRFKNVEDQYTAEYKLDENTKKYYIEFNAPDYEHFIFVLEPPDGEIKDRMHFINNLSSFIYTPQKNGNYKVYIKGVTENCKDILKTIYIDLPKYNPYAEDELCKGIEEFVLCQPTYSKDIDYDTFVSRVEVYKATKVRQEEEEKENNSIAKKIGSLWNYILDNIIIIIVIIIFIAAIVVSAILIAKSMRKSRRLE